MNNKSMLTSLLILTAFSLHANALTLTSKAFSNNGNIPYKYGYCQPDGKGRVKLSKDISPPLSWSNAPKQTQSFALIMTDPSIPNVPYFDLPHHQITSKAPRVTGYHWVVVDIPVTTTGLPEGAGSQGFVPGGKAPGQTPYGLMGINVYNGVFQAPIASRVEFNHVKASQMKGVYGKYDGPCAPWNDQVIHHYVLTLYALNTPKLKLPSHGHFSGPEAVAAMKGHILAQAVLTGKFITNPELMKK